MSETTTSTEEKDESITEPKILEDVSNKMVVTTSTSAGKEQENNAKTDKPKPEYFR